MFGRNSYTAINFVDQQLEVAYPGEIPEGQNFPEIVYESHSITPSQPLDAELEHFINAVRDGNKPLVTGEDGMEALRVAMQVTDIINQSNQA